MKVDRKTLLDNLQDASIGRVSGGQLETLEQCRNFVVKDGLLITFDGEVCYKKPVDLDFTASIPGEEFLKILEKLPDDEVDISLSNNEVRIKAKRRSAGIRVEDVKLPFDEVPSSGDWNELHEEASKMMKFAANTCGNDYSQILTTLVHVTPELIEASDSFRFFRAELETGFLEEFCVRGRMLKEIAKLPLTKASYATGWLHFECDDGAVISCRCSGEDYLEHVDQLLNVDGEICTLPDNLDEILERAKVMQNVDEGMPVAHMTISDNKITIKTQKDSGWFKEEKRIKYDGQPLSFMVNPQFLHDILAYTKEVIVGEERMKLEQGNIQFVAVLTIQD